MVDRVRYFLGVATVVVVPLGLLYWLVIHQWARWWRMWGPTRTYLVVLPVLTALGVSLYAVREQLLGADLGTKWSLIGVALGLSCVSTWLDLHYWRQLSIATLVGIPELSRQPSGGLLRDGMYGVVRHPRYLSAGIGLVASVLFVNRLGLYILIVCVLPLGYLMLVLEERELLNRFGKAYEEYRRDVPRLLPYWRKRPEKPPDKSTAV